ncbi:hypothetical protein BU14_0113s0014 [Porphyra umbilicalis]|uniref:Uncharacterized protein n=1 Tax=Porphyra umbilicalis TaxID=2786 RepID=A0A1X6PC01_PORUM|nr:hypothetical protein BU14_0113s0014 [Porphyra umbilicalis]|eukprot:OSX78270.1 hypothetical protein BU14_0113s0014 [Porphyra umbilicalis]
MMVLRTALSTAAGRGGAAAHFAPWAAVRAAGGVAGPRPLPPLNVALVWYLHRLAPAAYAADTAAAFAASSHLPPADAATADADGGEGGGGATTDGWAGNAGCPAVVVARLQWDAFAMGARVARRGGGSGGGGGGCRLRRLWGGGAATAPHAPTLPARDHLPPHLWPPLASPPGGGFGATPPVGARRRLVRLQQRADYAAPAACHRRLHAVGAAVGRRAIRPGGRSVGGCGRPLRGGGGRRWRRPWGRRHRGGGGAGERDVAMRAVWHAPLVGGGSFVDASGAGQRRRTAARRGAPPSALSLPSTEVSPLPPWARSATALPAAAAAAAPHHPSPPVARLPTRRAVGVHASPAAIAAAARTPPPPPSPFTRPSPAPSRSLGRGPPPRSSPPAPPPKKTRRKPPASPLPCAPPASRAPCGGATRLGGTRRVPPPTGARVTRRRPRTCRGGGRRRLRVGVRAAAPHGVGRR